MSTTCDTKADKKVTYPGTNNYTQWTYDGLGRRVKEVETRSGSITSTKQFVWSENQVKPLEARDALSNITAQYFSLGETISGTSCFWVSDHLGSVRENTNISGSVQAEYSYDPYGRVTQLQGSAASDLQYAAYYFHAPSVLNLTQYRPYASNLARWVSRDPIGESLVIARALSAQYVGRSISPKHTLTDATSLTGDQFGFGRNANLYSYVENDPCKYTDAAGLTACTEGCHASFCINLAFCLIVFGSNPPCAGACLAGATVAYIGCLKWCSGPYGPDRPGGPPDDFGGNIPGKR